MDLIWGIYAIPTPEAEYKFHLTRKWRFDYAWPLYSVAVEIEGGIWVSGRHTRSGGFIKDMEKYNEATRLGWKVFRFTPTELKKGVAQSYMLDVFNDSKFKIRRPS